ncbi:flavin-containing monooxygenase [Actinomadura physcomitrii]|uniref:flavin-containing monooxygenase n=1 Tax=Actinomadura physcomitrii TaxID=2650748 RepID=UPI001921866B|nr:NAD(P)/FAD-dependent oxidoreductase [Actinomadura physcomitrii]
MTEPTTQAPGPTFDPEALRKKYLEERDKRLRSDGLSQYIDLTGRFKEYAEDPYVEPGFTRDPITDESEVIILGGGFSGLITAARLRQAGVRDIRVIEKGGDFGGTWYWNRYPGIRCDVESYIYMPLLEELGYMPTEKYARGQEIFEYCQMLGKHFDLYDNACFQTRVTKIHWDEGLSRWIVETDRDDVMRARFIVLGSGGLHLAKLPGIPGIESFAGKAFHTSRWDYEYTGGDQTGNLTGLKGKRVAVIGTGATAIQCVPQIAKYAKHLYVFQRTPSSVDVRANGPTDPEWFASLEPGWQRERMQNFTSILVGRPQEEDLVNDRWTDVWAKAARLAREAAGEGAELDPAEIMQLADYEKMNQIRARVEEIVADPEVAESLKPWYNLWCKRPLFSDEFLQAFNQPNVTLVDTDGRGVDRITENAIEFGGESHEVDCIIFATGFRVGVPTYQAGEFTLTGRDGLDLADKWADGCKSLHGVYTRGFPNMFIVGNKMDAGLTTNVPHILGEQSAHVAALVKRCLDEGIETMEVRQEAEDGWAATMAEKAVDRQKFEEECTPGYFNNEGQKDRTTIFSGGYGGGPYEYIELCDQWRESGFEKDVDITYAR